MARYKPYDYGQMMMVPVSLEDQLVPGTLEYAIHQIVDERIDTSIFDEKYRNEEKGCCAYDPKVLLKVILLAYARGMLHSRPIERACKENITFMALACGFQPDHSTIATFVSSMGEATVVNLFTQVLLVCEEEGLLSGTHFSLDGLKLSSNASKEWSGSHKDLLKKQKNLEKKVKEAVREHREADRRGGDPDGKRRQDRIDRLRKKADRIGKFLAQNAPKKGKRGKEIQSNITDNESAKMKTSHGIVQGYNANAVVDDKTQIVVHPEVFGDGDDGDHVAPMLEGTRKNLEQVGKEDPLKTAIVTADTSFFSVKNLQACEEKEVDAYIPDPKFRQRDPRFADAARHRRPTDRHKQQYKKKPKQWFTPEDFTWDHEKNTLVCPAGTRLYIRSRRCEIKGEFFTSYQAPQRACCGCHLRSQCLRSKATTARQVYIHLGRRPGSLTDKMKEKIDTPEGRKTYSKRLAIVEPVFGNIRAQKRMDHFTLRGRAKVNIQWILYCLVHNLGKIANFGPTYAVAG